MNTIFRIIENQLELNDRIHDYDSYSFTGSEILEDEKGKYKIKTIDEEKPCSCHPETCCHFDGKIWRSREEKVYLKNKN